MKVLLTSILSIILIMGSTIASGEDIKEKFGIGFIGGLALHTGSVIDGLSDTSSSLPAKFNISASSDAENAGIYGLDIFYGLTEHIAFDLSMTYRNTNIKVDGIDWGDVRTIALIPSLQFRYPLSQIVTPYIDFGMGININGFNESSLSFGTAEDVIMDNSLALKIGTGLDYFLKENLCFNITLDWVLNKADTADKLNSAQVIDESTGTIYKTIPGETIGTWETDLSAFYLQLGVRYLF